MKRPGMLTFLLGLLATAVGVVVLLYALALGFHLAGSTTALVNSAKGQRIAVPAALAFALGVATLAGLRRRWAFPVACVGTAAAVLAVVLAIAIPSGTL